MSMTTEEDDRARLASERAQLRARIELAAACRARLMAAASTGDPSAVARAIEEGCDPKALAGWGESPLLDALSDANELAALALIPFSDLTVRSARDWTPLTRAAQNGMAAALAALLACPEVLSDQAGIDDALRTAASFGKPEALRLLLPLGDPLSESAEDHSDHGPSAGWTSMMGAARSGSRACCELLAPLSDLERRDPARHLCWEAARTQGHAELADWLEALALSRREAAALSSATPLPAADLGATTRL